MHDANVGAASKAKHAHNVTAGRHRTRCMLIIFQHLYCTKAYYYYLVPTHLPEIDDMLMNRLCHWYTAGHHGLFTSPPSVKEFVGAQCGMTLLMLNVPVHRRQPS